MDLQLQSANVVIDQDPLCEHDPAGKALHVELLSQAAALFRHEWAAKEKLKEQESAAAAAAAAAAEEAALEEAEMNAPAGVHFGTLPATRAAAGATADPSGTVAGDLSTSAAGLQKVGLTFDVMS